MYYYQCMSCNKVFVGENLDWCQECDFGDLEELEEVEE